MRLYWNFGKDRYEFESRYEERRELGEKGAMFDPKAFLWYCPSEDVAQRFQFCAVGPAEQMLRKRAERMDASVKLSHAQDAPVEEAMLVPEGRELYPFQRAGVHWLRNHDRALIADDMGLGKTVQALAFLNDPNFVAASFRSQYSVLVICPSSVRSVWEREAAEWLLPERYATWQPEVMWKRNCVPETSFLICSYDMLDVVNSARGPGAEIVIVDEAHYVKNPATKRHKNVRAACENAEHVIFLSGTPIANRPREAWGILHAMDPRVMGRWRDFAWRYCDPQHNGYGWDFNGCSNLGELQGLLRSKVMIRRRKKEVLKELPEKIRTVVELPADHRGREALEKEGRLDQNRLFSILSGSWDRSVEEMKNDEQEINHLAEASIRRHETALAKVPQACGFIRDVLENEDKVVVFAHHADVVQQLEYSLRTYGVRTITGKTPAKRRGEAVEAFQSDKNTRVIIGNIIAMGTGLTLTAASTVVFVELDWVPGNMSQAEDRCHRIGQRSAVSVYHLVVRESIDARLAKMLLRKQQMITRAVG